MFSFKLIMTACKDLIRLAFEASWPLIFLKEVATKAGTKWGWYFSLSELCGFYKSCLS
jgi:hypothetical protein